MDSLLKQPGRARHPTPFPSRSRHRGIYRYSISLIHITAFFWIIFSWIMCCECFKDKNLTIGGIFPMQGSWAGGVGCFPAVEMALEDINNRTDVLPDYQLWMVEKDSLCMPGLGTKVLYELLYTPPTKIMVLTGCSSVSTFVAQAAKMWNLVVLGWGSSSPALSNRERFPTFFRTHPSATIHNPTRVELFKKFKWTRIATIQETLEVFQSTVEDLEERVKVEGIDIVVRQSFLTDPTNAVKNLKRQDARIIVGVFYEDMARRVFCQVYKEKLYGRKYVWFIIGWYPDNWYAQKDANIDCTPEQMKEALEGHFTTEAIMLNKKPTVTRSNMTSQQFKERLDRKLNVTDTSQVPGYPEAPLAYDAVWALALALNKASARLEKRQMKLEDFDYTNKEITDEIYSAMNSTKFLGVSGEVAFSSSGDRIACTQIEQMIDGVYHQVGAFDFISGNLTWLDNEVWIGGSPPPDRTKKVEFQRVVSPGVFFAMCGLATLGIMAGVAALIFNALNRHRRSIADPSPDPFDEIVDAPTTYRYITDGTQKGKDRLVDSVGYSYAVKERKGQTTYWTCSVRNKKQHCRATVKEKDGEFIPGKNDHIHPAMPDMFTSSTVAREVKRCAKENMFTPSSTIVEKVLTEHVDVRQPTPSLPAPSHLCRTANRAREQHRPENPKDLNFEIAEGHLPHRFLRADLRVGEHRHLVFYTDSQLRLLERSKTWYMDATFKIVDTPFSQLFSIHAFVRSGGHMKQVPLVCVLMSRRRRRDYKKVFQHLKDAMTPPFSLKSAVADFERGMWAGFRSCFDQVPIRGCSFHWGQAVYRKIQSLGLESAYFRQDATHKLLRKVLSLPYLPADDIPPTVDQLRRFATTPALTEFFEYLQKTWLESTVWPVSSWSVFGKSVRTNNDVEGWHRRINHKATRSNIQFYLLVPLLFKESELVTIQMKLVSEGKLKRTQRKATREAQAHIMSLWEAYRRRELSATQLLRDVSMIQSL